MNQYVHPPAKGEIVEQIWLLSIFMGINQGEVKLISDQLFFDLKIAIPFRDWRAAKIYTLYEVHAISFQTFFVWAFKIVVCDD